MPSSLLARRSFAFVAAAAVALSTTLGAAVVRAAVADDTVASPLHFVDFIKASELTAPDGSHPDGGGLTMAGVFDGAGGRRVAVLHDRLNQVLSCT